MNRLFERYNIKVGESIIKGIAKIEAFEIESKNSISKIRLGMQGGLFSVKDGRYLKLHVGNELMMSDTHMERRTNYNFVSKANGDVLIAGLGIGMILSGIESKLIDGSIKSITIIEKHKDVIDLISPFFNDIIDRHNVSIINECIFSYRPEKSKKWDTIYFDIWPDICQDNLDEISKLHNKFKFKIKRDNPLFFMDSWMKDHLKYERNRNRVLYSY